MQPEKLINEISGAGFFLLLNIYESWGVLIHENGVTGLPLDVTRQVGATKSFLIYRFNGFYFNTQYYRRLNKKFYKSFKYQMKHS